MGCNALRFTQTNSWQRQIPLVVTEAAIDLWSYYQLHHATQPETLYISTGGTPEQDQEKQLAAIFKAYSGAWLVLATDADSAGDKFAEQVVALAPKGMKLDRHTPPTCKDWNAHLQSLKGSNQGMYSTAA